MVTNLFPCPDCEHMVSRRAVHCPSCGHQFVAAILNREGLFLRTMNVACVGALVAIGGAVLLAIAFWALTALGSMTP